MKAEPQAAFDRYRCNGYATSDSRRKLAGDDQTTVRKNHHAREPGRQLVAARMNDPAAAIARRPSASCW
jgi:hypothetical protein